MKLADTVERINPVHFRSKEKYLLYLRHVFAYEHVASRMKPTDHVLEIGFGEGYGSILLAEHAGTVTALDVDHDLVDHANQRHARDEVSFGHYEGEVIPYGDDTFDHVVSMQVIEHIEDDVQFVREAHRVLKPGGYCWITTPNRAHRIPPGGKIWNPFHVREYLPQELADVLTEVFDDVSVLGIAGTQEVLRTEHKRVSRGMSFRKLIPEPVKALLDGDVETRYSTRDFHVAKDEDVVNSLDLLGVCRK